MKINPKTHNHQILHGQNEGENVKAAGEKGQVTYKGKHIRLTVDFSRETLHARREQEPIFNILKEKSVQHQILYLAKLSFTSEGEINPFQISKC